MLAGAPPFRRDQSLAVMWAQLSAPPPALTSQRPDLPAAVDQVMFRALAKAPEDRFPSCRAFATALQEACGVSAADLPARSAAAQALAGAPPAGAASPAPDEPGLLAAEAVRPQTMPVSPAAGFPAPPPAAPPTSADPPYVASPASAEVSRLAVPAGADLPRAAPPGGADASCAAPPASSAASSRLAPPRRAEEPYVPAPGPAGHAGPPPPASWPPQRPGPPGPPRPQPARRRRHGLALVATAVVLLAVVAAGLALLKHRSQLSSGAPGTRAPGGASTVPAVVSAPASPPTVVKRYYAAISRRDYARAWKLGGDNTRTSYPRFVAGFNHTQRDAVTILTWTGDQVTAKIAAFQTDGSVMYFQGAYVVDSGVITSFNVHQVG